MAVLLEPLRYRLQRAEEVDGCSVEAEVPPKEEGPARLSIFVPPCSNPGCANPAVMQVMRSPSSESARRTIHPCVYKILQRQQGVVQRGADKGEGGCVGRAVLFANSANT